MFLTYCRFYFCFTDQIIEIISSDGGQYAYFKVQNSVLFSVKYGAMRNQTFLTLLLLIISFTSCSNVIENINHKEYIERKLEKVLGKTLEIKPPIAAHSPENKKSFDLYYGHPLRINELTCRTLRSKAIAVINSECVSKDKTFGLTFTVRYPRTPAAPKIGGIKWTNYHKRAFEFSPEQMSIFDTWQTRNLYLRYLQTQETYRSIKGTVTKYFIFNDRLYIIIPVSRNYGQRVEILDNRGVSILFYYHTKNKIPLVEFIKHLKLTPGTGPTGM